jgi:hypothetical protein
MFQRENHFINRRSQKPRRLNLKCMPAVNYVNKTNRNRYCTMAAKKKTRTQMTEQGIQKLKI